MLGLPAASADEPIAPVTAPVAPVPSPDPAEPESSSVASDSLAEVQQILAEGETDGRDLTMALRDLRLHQDELSRTDRRAARKVLGRPLPDSAPYADFGPVRVHWSAKDASITPAWINFVGTTSQQVLTTYAEAGYRAPKADGGRGGSDQLDIYVIALDPGLYGYCDSDVVPPNRGPYDVPAFCAFDNDYAGFPGTPEQTLQVTAAHELFHAVQFGYDYEEDRWFLEATATWAEDELFDDVNDNYQYLSVSPLRQPRQSLDQYSRSSLRQYGEWIFFRYLSERWPEETGTMPTVILRLMQRIDGAKGGPDLYSMRAIERELKARKTSLRQVYADFSDANRRPALTYREGSAYRAAKPSASWTLSGKRRDTGVRRTKVNHLASATARLTPGAGAHGRLRVQVMLPKRRAAAVVSVYRKDGAVTTKTIKVNRQGRGKVRVRFDRRTIRFAEVTLVNASARYKCWQGPQGRAEILYSCRGRPLDQRVPMAFRARLLG